MNITYYLPSYLILCKEFLDSKSIWKESEEEPEIGILKNALLMASSIIDEFKSMKRQDWEGCQFKNEVKNIANRIWACINNRNDIISKSKYIMYKGDISDFLAEFDITGKKVTISDLGTISGKIEENL